MGRVSPNVQHELDVELHILRYALREFGNEAGHVPAAAAADVSRPPWVQVRQRNPSSFGPYRQPWLVGSGPERASIGSGSISIGGRA